MRVRGTFGDINDKQHHVDDLGASNDGPHEGCMARAVHQRELHLVERLPCCMFWKGGLQKQEYH